jgi:hypothetical protein
MQEPVAGAAQSVLLCQHLLKTFHVVILDSSTAEYTLLSYQE